MITKTYLDSRLNDLEEKIKKRIDLKDSRQTAEINENINNLKDVVKLLEEKILKNRDMMDNYLQNYNDIKKELAELKIKIESFEDKKINIRETDIKNDKSDIIVSDI